MFVYLVISGIAYEGENVVGVFSDYVQARECELKHISDYGYTMIRKVEVNKVYDDVFQGIGEEV